jgi:hypothetical protein
LWTGFAFGSTHPYQTYAALRLREADEKRFGCRATPCHALYPLTAAQQPVVKPILYTT